MGESLPQDPVSVQLAAIYLSAFPSCLTLTYLLERATVLATRLPMLRGERLQHALVLNKQLHGAIWVLWPVHPRCEERSDDAVVL